MSREMLFKELEEAEGVFKEVALQKIAALIKAHDLSQADVLSAFPDSHRGRTMTHHAQPAKRFDPFFDA